MSINPTEDMLRAIETGDLDTLTMLIDAYGFSHTESSLEGYILLCKALKKSQIALVKLLLNRGARVNSETVRFIDSPLHIAVKKNDIEMADLLVKKHAEIDAKDECGATPLHHAAGLGYTEMVVYLLKNIARIDAKDHYDKTPLHYAACGGHTRIVEYLLKNSADVNAKNNFGATPFHYAARGCNGELIKYLLQNGSCVNAKDNGGATPFHYAACGSGDSSTLEYLLLNGAELDAKDKSGATPLHYAARGCNTDLCITPPIDHSADHISRNNARVNDDKDHSDQTPLDYAAPEDHTKMVEYLLRKDANVKGHSSETPLHYAACRRGDSSTANYLLLNGTELDAKDPSGATPLDYAAPEDHTKMVGYLLRKGADVNAKGHSGETPLHCAARGCNADLCITPPIDHSADHISRNNARVNDNKDHSDPAPLDYAAPEDHTRMVEYLLRKDANVKGHSSETPLHYAACRRGDSSTADYLLLNGTELDAKDPSGTTPLDYAAPEDHTKMVEYLLRKGADVNAKGHSGETPLYCAARGRNADLCITPPIDHSADHISRNNARVNDNKDHSDPRSLDYAAPEDHTKMVEYLLRKGADVNAKGHSGETPLHYAARGCNAEMIEYLLRNNASVDSKDESGATPLHYAARKAHMGIVEYLLQNDANVNAKVNDGATALHYAVGLCNTEMVEYFLKNGASVDSKDRDGATPLHYAARKGHVRIVEYLLQNDLDVNVKDHSGATPLHYSAKGCNTKIVECLLRKCACVDGKDNYGATPLHYAAREGDTTMVEYLLKNHGSSNAKDISGATPLHYAARRFDAEILKYLARHNYLDGQKKSCVDLISLPITWRKEQIMEILLNHGANVNSSTGDGYTPLHDAAHRIDTKIIEYLLHNGADVNAITKDRFTALHIVMKKSFEEAVNIIKKHIVKIRALNLYVDNENSNMVDLNDEFMRFEDDCKREIRMMKNGKISDTIVSYYDLVTNDISQLALYSRNEIIVKILASSDFDEICPIYCDIIRNRFKIGQRYEILLNASLKSLDFLSDCELPELVSQRVLSLLNDNDLYNLIKAGLNDGKVDVK